MLDNTTSLELQDRTDKHPLKMARGKLVVFEGLDRAGKSTQCEKLVAALRQDGGKVTHMRFPGAPSILFTLLEKFSLT